MVKLKKWSAALCLFGVLHVPTSLLAQTVDDLPELRRAVKSACPEMWEDPLSIDDRLIYTSEMHESSTDIWAGNLGDKAQYIKFALRYLRDAEGGFVIKSYSDSQGVIEICTGQRNLYLEVLADVRNSDTSSFDPGSVRDDDGDGIFNNLDQCRATPLGEVVHTVADSAERPNINTTGCAASERDIDLDGVNDDLDVCPNTFPGSVIDPNDGCVDSDEDGKSDRTDSYPFQHDTQCTD